MIDTIVNKNNKIVCERCGNDTLCHTVSWFNKQVICLDCDKEELSHPDIKKAKDIENQHCKNGNYNFEGIGLPKDLQLKYNCKTY